MNQTDNDKISTKFPRYFIVDGVPVKVVLEADKVAGYSYDGSPFGLGKALEGREVNESDYTNAVALLTDQKQ